MRTVAAHLTGSPPSAGCELPHSAHLRAFRNASYSIPTSPGRCRLRFSFFPLRCQRATEGLATFINSVRECAGAFLYIGHSREQSTPKSIVRSIYCQPPFKWPAGRPLRLANARRYLVHPAPLVKWEFFPRGDFFGFPSSPRHLQGIPLQDACHALFTHSVKQRRDRPFKREPCRKRLSPENRLSAISTAFQGDRGSSDTSLRTFAPPRPREVRVLYAQRFSPVKHLFSIFSRHINACEIPPSIAHKTQPSPHPSHTSGRIVNHFLTLFHLGLTKPGWPATLPFAGHGRERRHFAQIQSPALSASQGAPASRRQQTPFRHVFITNPL